MIMTRKRKQRALGRTPQVILAVCVALVATTARGHDPTTTQEPQAASGAHAFPEHGSLADVGAKLSDPSSNVWALFTEFDLTFYDGDVNAGDPEIGGNMTFQPILPVPLYGEAERQWKLLTRPTLPFIFSNPVPTNFDTFDHEGGLGDMFIPTLLSPPVGNWIAGLGPTWLFPTATKDAFGREQFGVGPAAILGYKTKKLVIGVFPQHFFKIGSVGDQADKPDASFGEILYFGYLNLPDAWQVGFSPTITYDTKASSGNKWNVPVGLTVAKTTSIAKKPVKFQLGFEYSVVSQDDFGKRFLIKLNVIPVISALINKPLFGGE